MLRPRIRGRCFETNGAPGTPSVSKHREKMHRPRIRERSFDTDGTKTSPSVSKHREKMHRPQCLSDEIISQTDLLLGF